MHRGYVKLWRRSLEGGWLSNPKLWVFWCYCLIKASHKPVKSLIGYQEVNLLPGQFIFGRKKCSKELGISEKSVRTCLQALKSANNVAIKAANKFSIITIINWDIYQGDDSECGQQDGQQDGQQGANKGPARGHIQTLKAFKNVKKKEKHLSKIFDFTLSQPFVEFATSQNIPPERIEEIFSQFCDHHRAKGTKIVDWLAAWRTWIRNEIKWARTGRRTLEPEPCGFDYERPGYYKDGTKIGDE
jgi:hypothetical protein